MSEPSFPDLTGKWLVDDVTPPGWADPGPVFKYLGYTDAEVTAMDDDQFGQILQAYRAEVTAQARVCRTDPYRDDLMEALHRRVKRNLALRDIPLGSQSFADGTSAPVGRRDPEIARLEGPYRIAPIG